MWSLSSNEDKYEKDGKVTLWWGVKLINILSVTGPQLSAVINHDECVNFALMVFLFQLKPDHIQDIMLIQTEEFHSPPKSFSSS